MFDITQPAQGQYDYLDGVPAAQAPGIKDRYYGEDMEYGEPPQLQRSAEQLGTLKTERPQSEPEIKYKPKTKEDYYKFPLGEWYEDTDGEVYQKVEDVVSCHG